MPTVADVLRRIERIRKDLDYVRGFQEKWRDQQERFPKIYEGICAQEKAFLQEIDELRNLGVNADEGKLKKRRDEDQRPLLTPAIEGQSDTKKSGRRRRDSRLPRQTRERRRRLPREHGVGAVESGARRRGRVGGTLRKEQVQAEQPEERPRGAARRAIDSAAFGPRRG